MNADNPTMNHPAGDEPVERKKEKICWPCILAAIPPLLLTLLFGLYIAEALKKGREIAGPTAALSTPVEPEAAEDGAFVALRLQEELAAAQKELDATNKELAALKAAEQDDGPRPPAAAAVGEEQDKGEEDLAARLAALPKAELAALLESAATELAPPPTSAREAYAMLQGLPETSRTALFATLPSDPAVAEWFNDLSAREKRSWLERFLGRGALGAVAIDGERADAALPEDEQRAEISKAEVAALRTSLAQRESALERANDTLTAATDKVEDLQKRFAAESQKRSAFELELGQLTARVEADAETRKQRESELAAQRQAALDQLANVQEAEGKAQEALAAAEKRADRLRVSLERAREGLARRLAAEETGERAAPDAAQLLATLSALPDVARSEVYADLAPTLFATPEFKNWLSSEDAAADRAALAGLVAPPQPSEPSAAESAEALSAELKDAQQALAEAVEQINDAETDRDDAKRDSERAAARLATLEARLASADTAARDAAAAEAASKAKSEEIERLKNQLAEAEERAAKPPAPDLKTAAASAEKSARILELEKQLEAAPQTAELAALRQEMETLRKAAEEAQLALKEEIAGRAAARAAQARANGGAPATRPAERQVEAPVVAAAAVTKLTLPEIGEIDLSDAPNAVADLLRTKDREARRLRSENVALKTKLIAATAEVAELRAAPEPASDPGEAPGDQEEPLAIRDRSLREALSENVALKAKLALIEPTASAPRRAPSRPASDGVAATAVYPKWREAPLQKVGGVELNVLSQPIAFASASADLTKEGRKAVRKLARQLIKSLKKAPKEQWRLVIEGHTDQRPIRTKEFASNWDLSSARAAAVAWELQKQGVPSTRLLAVGRAAADPVDARWTQSAFAMNRRIELSLLRLGGRSRAAEK